MSLCKVISKLMPQGPLGIRQVRVEGRSVSGKGTAFSKAMGWKEN